ncbi:hypothetical protein [Enhygromyxa salina]|uniref:hypothetical protein n=1 Tax=Enhygromyxa salina TaxID=215803 RepID=UPI0011B27C19|nr:hypothetical protein [Enhygromyxa salina]
MNLTATLTRRLAWVLLALGCKPAPSRAPEPDSRKTTADYGDAAYATSIQPIRVCEHLARMVAAEAGRAPQFDPVVMETCAHELSIEAATRGSADWRSVAACVLEAETGDEVDDCDRRYPMPSAASGSGDTDRERAVCDHMFDVVMRETAEELGSGGLRFSEGERRALTDECVESFVVDHRPELDAVSYEQLLACLASAQTGVQMQEC